MKLNVPLIMYRAIYEGVGASLTQENLQQTKDLEELINHVASSVFQNLNYIIVMDDEGKMSPSPELEEAAEIARQQQPEKEN